MSRVVVWHFGGGVMYPESTSAKTRGRIQRGLNAYRLFVRKTYKIDFRIRRSATEGVKISVNPVVLNGVDYRGVARNKAIELHNGWIASHNKWYDLFPVPQGLGQIWTHEWLHIIGLGHSLDEKDLMHSNSPPTLTTTLPTMTRLFGKIQKKPKTEASIQEVAREIAAAKQVAECYVGRVEF